MKQKYYVELNRQEWRLIIEGLNRFRNKLIAAGRYTDAVDEILIKAAEVNVVGMEALMMEKYITDEHTGLKYELVGDYYLIAGDDEPEQEQEPIGIWGQRHLRYLKEDRRVRYANLLTTGKLNDYLADLNEQAEAMFSQLVKLLAEMEGVTEVLKAENQMLWVQKMDNLRNTAMEIVLNELIYC